jgi:hypothetical protein
MRTVVAAIRSLAAYVGVSLYVAITAPVGMALALTFRWKAVLYVLGHGGVTLGAGLAGIRTRVEGIRIVGRSTQGVIVFDTAEGERVVSVERISEEGDDNGG